MRKELLVFWLVLLVGHARAETQRSPQKRAIVLLPVQGIAESAAISREVCSTILDGLAGKPGMQVLQAADAAAARESDPAFKARVDETRAAFADALRSYEAMNYENAERILEAQTASLPEICAHLLYPQLGRDLWMLHGLTLHAKADRKGAVEKFSQAIAAAPAMELRKGVFSPEVVQTYEKARKASVSREERSVEAEQALECVSAIDPAYLFFAQVFYAGKLLNLSISLYDVSGAKEFSLSSMALEQNPQKRRKTVLRAVSDLISLGVTEPDQTALVEESTWPGPPALMAQPEAAAASTPDSASVEARLEEERAQSPAPGMPAAGRKLDASPKRGPAIYAIVGWTSAAVAAVSAGVATTFGILVKKTEVEIEDLVAKGNPRITDPVEYQNLKDKGEQRALLANVFWGIAIGSAAVSAGAFLLDWKTRTEGPLVEMSFVPAAGPGYFGVALQLVR